MDLRNPGTEFRKKKRISTEFLSLIFPDLKYGMAEFFTECNKKRNSVEKSL
jgi:hypothetical protein